jgi:uncharacterized protein (TIGR02757 family)
MSRHRPGFAPVACQPPGAALHAALEDLYRRFERRADVADPVRVLAHWSDPADREVVAFCAASLAFGRVASVLASLEGLLAALGPRPARFVRGFDPRRHAALLGTLGHRWTRGEDLAALLLVLRHMLHEHGSIEACFAAGLPPGAPDVTGALETFSRRALEVDVAEAYRPPRTAAPSGRAAARRPGQRPGVAFFFPRPSAGSACKRLNLFLRWMVRRDAVDPGGWTAVSPSQLIVPLDVHVVRVGRCLGLTRYRSPGWRMAADITAALRRLDPADPVKYDFALCHLGMLNVCGFGRAAGDRACPLRGFCRPGSRRPRASRPPSARR